MSRTLTSYLALPALAMMLAGGLFTGCGDDASKTDDGSGSTMDAAGGSGTGDKGSGTGDRAGGAGGAATMDTRNTTATEANKAPLTPAEERTSTSEDFRGLRAILAAELETVRARLKEAGRPDPEKKADQTRAAELAQGLERIDRAIKTIDESDDVTWATIRESELKEAEDVREWMAQYGMNVGV